MRHPKPSPIACNQCYPHLRPEYFTLRAERLKAFFEECDLFVFPSEFLADRYVAWGLPAAKSVVIHNGQENISGKIDRSRHSAALNRFGFFGQFIDNKGIDKHYATNSYMIEIKEILEQLGPYRQQGIQIIDRERYGRDELADRMASIDWVLVPSTWWEVFGLVVSEAWMFGRPVIASDIGGLGERIEHGVNGLKFKPRDVRALADLIVTLTGKNDVWRKLHSGAPLQWSDIDMFKTYLEVWTEGRTKQAAE